MKNGIQIFQNKELDIKVRIILNSDSSISVSAEDTAIGFGWSREKNGKNYIMWDRFNGFCEVLGFPHKCGSDDFIPESLYYLLGMKANNVRAQNYQRWIAMEVLPSIRKTGSYSLEQKQEEAYEYFDKMFNGVPVVSTLDIAHFTGIQRLTVNWYVRKSNLICGIDYFVAEGSALAEMKRKYPRLSTMISRMLLITKSGFNKVMRTNGIKIAPLPCFNEQTKALEKPKTIYALVAQNIEIQDSMQKIREKMRVLDAVMSCYNKYNTDIETSKGLSKTIESVGGDILMEAYKLSGIKPQTTTEKIN